MIPRQPRRQLRRGHLRRWHGVESWHCAPYLWGVSTGMARAAALILSRPLLAYAATRATQSQDLVKFVAVEARCPAEVRLAVGDFRGVRAGSAFLRSSRP